MDENKNNLLFDHTDLYSLKISCLLRSMHSEPIRNLSGFNHTPHSSLQTIELANHATLHCLETIQPECHGKVQYVDITVHTHVCVHVGDKLRAQVDRHTMVLQSVPLFCVISIHVHTMQRDGAFHVV